MRALTANPINSPKVSFSGNALDIWVCAQGFSVTYENGGGDCAFGITGGFLISPYVDTDTAECFLTDEDGVCVNWAWAGISEKTNDYRVGDIPAIKANWHIEKLLPSTAGEVTLTKGVERQPVIFSYSEGDNRYTANMLSNGKDITWRGEYSEASLYLLPDINGNGASEIGLFGIRADEGYEGRAQLFIRDTATGNRVSVLNWVANWENTDIIVLPDISGDGVAEIGLQGLFKEGQRPQLVVRNSLTSAYISTFSFPSLWNNPKYQSFSDANQDGTKDVALFGTIAKNNKPQVKVVDGTLSSNKLSAYTFPDSWNNTTWVNVSDFNSDSADDWALLGQAKADGRWQLVIKSGLSPKGALSIYAWPNLANITYGRVSDTTEDDIKEFAVGGFSESKNRWQLQIKDGQNRNNTLYNVSWPNKWLEASIHILNDIDGDGIEELAVMGKRTNYELAIKLSRDGYVKEHRVDLGSEWSSKPYIGAYDFNGDGERELAAFAKAGNKLHTQPIYSPVDELINYHLTINHIISSQEGSICNTEDEYVGLEGTDSATIALDEFAQRATLIYDIEGDGSPIPITGEYSATEGTVNMVHETDVFALFITSQSESSVSLNGTITTTDTRDNGMEQCVTVWDLAIDGSR